MSNSMVVHARQDSGSRGRTRTDKRMDRTQAAPSIMAEDTGFTDNFVRCFSPRTQEACRVLGILPEEVVLKPYEAFHEHGISPDLQKLRYQDYEQARQEAIYMVRQQRTEYVTAGWRPPSPLHDTRSRSKSRSPGMRGSSRSRSPHKRSGAVIPFPSLAQSQSMGQLSNRSGNAGMSTVELEQARMQKILRRQNKEVEKMMAYEVKVANLLAKQERTQAVRKQKEDALRAQKKQETMELEEKRRLWQEQKRDEEKAERDAARAAARKLQQKEKAYAQEQQKKQQARRAEAKLRAQRRREKHDEMQRRQHQLMEEQTQLMEQKQKEMDKRNSMRKKALLQKKKMMAQIHAEKTRRARIRVMNVQEEQEAQIAQRRRELGSKMAQQKRRMADHEAEKKRLVAEKMEKEREKEEKRRELLEEQEKHQIEKITGILERNKHYAQIKEDIDRKEMEEIQFKQEVARLNKRRKEVNLARIQRQQAYRREMLVEKVNEDAERIAMIEDERQRLLQERQRNQIMLSMKKKELVKAFETLRVSRNWKQLAKLNLGMPGLPVPGGEGQGSNRSMSKSQSAAQIGYR